MDQQNQINKIPPATFGSRNGILAGFIVVL